MGSEETGEDVFAVLDWGYDVYQERNVRLAALASLNASLAGADIVVWLSKRNEA